MIWILLLSLNAGARAETPLKGPVALPSPTAGIQSFSEETERDLSLKREVPLYISHHLGNLSVQGWVQDRIRVKITKRVFAATQAQAEAEMKKLDLVSLETNESFELGVGHARGNDLVTKMRDEKESSVTVDLEIKAPYHMDLTVLLGDQKSLNLQQWKGGIHFIGRNSQLNFSRLNLLRDANVNCQNCEMTLSDSKVRGHFLAGNRNVLLKDVESEKSTLVDTTTGEIRLEQTKGPLTLHSTTGRISSFDHQGRLMVQSEDGGIFVNGLKGDLEATTQSGQIMIDAEQVDDHLHLDGDKSDIQVTLPAKFEGLLDLLSLRGEVVVEFPNEPNRAELGDTYGPVSPGRVDATVGTHTDVTVHAYSKQGGVRILRKVPKR